MAKQIRVRRQILWIPARAAELLTIDTPRRSLTYDCGTWQVNKSAVMEKIRHSKRFCLDLTCLQRVACA